VTVDGEVNAQAKTLSANCDTVDNCITAIGSITGATVTNVDNKIKITSSSAGSSSTIAIEASSGTNAKLLFSSNPVVENGYIHCEESASKLVAECRCREETCAANKFCTPESECLATDSMATVKPCLSGKIAGYNKDKYDRTCCESCSVSPTNCVELIDMAAKEDGCYSDCTKAFNAAGINGFLGSISNYNCTSEQIQEIKDYHRPPSAPSPSAPSPASPSPSSTSIYKTVASTPSVEDDEDEFIFNDSLSTGGGKVMIWKMFLIGMAGVLVLTVV
jgi:hypothetical protein